MHSLITISLIFWGQKRPNMKKGSLFFVCLSQLILFVMFPKVTNTLKKCHNIWLIWTSIIFILKEFFQVFSLYLLYVPNKVWIKALLDWDLQEEVAKWSDLFGAQEVKGLELRRWQETMVVGDLIPPILSNTGIPINKDLGNISLGSLTFRLSGLGRTCWDVEAGPKRREQFPVNAMCCLLRPLLILVVTENMRNGTWKVK